jgi:WD40 repeat protein
MQTEVLRRYEKVHGGGCNSITFSPSGLHAATCGQDGVVRLWSEDGTLSSELKPAHAQSASSINFVTFAEDKGLVMGASNDHSIQTWDMHTGRPRFTMTGARHNLLPSQLVEPRSCSLFHASRPRELHWSYPRNLTLLESK